MDWHPVISVQQQTPDNDFCHFSISNVRFAFWAFFENRKNSGLTPGKNDDPVTRWPGRERWPKWPTDPVTHWPSSVSALYDKRTGDWRTSCICLQQESGTPQLSDDPGFWHVKFVLASQSFAFSRPQHLFCTRFRSHVLTAIKLYTASVIHTLQSRNFYAIGGYWSGGPEPRG